MRLKTKLTDAFAVKAEPNKNVYWDGQFAGFGLRVSSPKARSWVFGWRGKNDRKWHQLTIGDLATWPAAKARQQAAEWGRIVDTGGDLHAVLRPPLVAPVVTVPTFGDAVKRYRAVELPAKAAKTQEDYNRMFDMYLLPAWGDKPLDSIRRIDGVDLHAEITAQINPHTGEGKHRRANAVIVLGCRIFSLSVEWELCTKNPLTKFKRNPENERTRFLNKAESARLNTQLDFWSPTKTDSVDMVRLLWLTGSRLGEVVALTWGMLDLDGAVWIKPAPITKPREEQVLPLSPEVVAILRRRRDEAGTVSLPNVRVFNNGDCRARVERDWRLIRAAAGLNDLRLHDFRHDHASILVANGMNLPVVGKLLGHQSIRTTEKYAHLDLGPQRAAAELVGRIVGKIGS